MALPTSPKVRLVVIASLFGLTFIVAYAFVAYLKDPQATDGCLAEYEACRYKAEGLTGAADCGIELYHCRALGEHAQGIEDTDH
jgi:hypothetical protein